MFYSKGNMAYYWAKQQIYVYNNVNTAFLFHKFYFKDFIFKRSFRFITKLRGRYRGIPCTPIYAQPPPLSKHGVCGPVAAIPNTQQLLKHGSLVIIIRYSDNCPGGSHRDELRHKGMLGRLII